MSYYIALSTAAQCTDDYGEYKTLEMAKVEVERVLCDGIWGENEKGYFFVPPSHIQAIFIRPCSGE